MNFKSKITQLHYDKNAEGFFVDLLEFFSLFYGLVSKLRNNLYDNGILKEEKVAMMCAYMLMHFLRDKDPLAFLQEL